MTSLRQPGGVILPFKDKHPQIDETAFIAENAVIIGDVTIGVKSSIWYSCVLRGDMNFIRIGNDTNIQDGTVVHVDSKGYPTILGDRVTVGHMALLHACTLEDDAGWNTPRGGGHRVVPPRASSDSRGPPHEYA